MKTQLLCFSILFSLIALPALATVKVYDSNAQTGATPGDVFQYTIGLCPPIQSSLGTLQGNHELEDTGGGSVTMNSYVDAILTNADFTPAQLTSLFGPGAFVFVNARTSTSNVLVPHIGTGSTAPGGTVTWGVLSGWVNTGFVFCASSPISICEPGTGPHGVTAPIGQPNSATYDLGTWSFDAEGDLLATSYITGTSMGGTSNRQSLVRGSYVGASVPALPLIGAGALALGLAVAGTRSVLRKK